ncbi:MAG TPA: mandelate racemase/muconate lactonizing enzyme family protein [Burkholderiales bacterium]|nr:mandelate racemase/muconate lactonizing enzyme family protein [Burkholderiales bacterium]
MKIEAAKVSVLRVLPAKPYEAAGKIVDAFWHVLAEVTTSDGVKGFGYMVALSSSMVPAVASAARELSQVLVGMHVLETEAAWERMARKGSPFGPGGLLHQAIAPLDVAMWDAAGKTLKQPLYRLLGGYCDRLPVYGSDGFWYSLTLEELAKKAAQYVKEGYTAVKLRLGHETNPAREVRRVNAVREAVGPEVRILVDATETWDLATALNTGYALQEAGIHWLEDPIATENIAGLARLCQQLRVRIATGEHFYTANDFARLFEGRATAVALIDLGRIGGITPWRRVAALAQTYGIPVCGHVLPEVHVHLATAIPNGYLVEYVPRSAEILRAMPAVEGGCLVAPKSPGLGLELDEEAVRRFTYAS